MGVRLLAVVCLLSASLFAACGSDGADGTDGGVIEIAGTTKEDLGTASDLRAYVNRNCGEIQGSDVADFTEGHRVLAADGSVLARCRARAG